MAKKSPPVPRVFDRLVQFDERSRAFPVRALIPKAAKPRSYTWGCSLWLDQGSEGACVGFSVSHEAAARPVAVLGVTNETAFKLYKRAQDLDEWPSNDYDGTSVLAGVKAAQELGWFPEYRWGFSLADAVLALGYKGPGVAGLNWYEGMFDTDAEGFIRPTGALAGGHAILVRGVSVKGRYVTLRNSWGRAWGVDGDCRLTFDDFDRLLHERGEFCIPVKRGKAA